MYKHVYLNLKIIYTIPMNVSLPIGTMLDTINATAQNAYVPKFPFRTYPVSSWIFITMGSLSFRYPVLIIVFVVYQIFNSYAPDDSRPYGSIIDIIEFIIGYKLANTLMIKKDLNALPNMHGIRHANPRANNHHVLH